MIAALAAALALARTPAPSAAAAPAPPPSAPAPAAAPALPFQARAEKTEVQLGQPFGYEIEVRHGSGVTVSLPGTLPSGAFHLEAGRCRREETEGDVVTTCGLRLALFALGPNDVPELDLVVTGPTGSSTLKVPGPRITGAGVLDPSAPPEKLALRDLAPPAPLLVRSLRLVWWTLGVLAALAAALLAWTVWRRRRTRAVEAPPPLPPHERCARRLARLEADRLGERGHAREHFYRLSEIVREYLGALLGVPALDLTSEELLARVRETGDPRLEPEVLRPFLEDVDLVKFARAPAGPAECESSVAFARALLDRTRPPEPPPGAAQPAPAEGRPG